MRSPCCCPAVPALACAPMGSRGVIVVSLLASLVAAPAIAVTHVACGESGTPCSALRAHNSCSPGLGCCEVRSSSPLPAALNDAAAPLPGTPVVVAVAGIPVPSARLVSIDAGLLPPPSRGPPLFLKICALLI